MSLSVLKSRLLHELPQKHHKTVQREFSRYTMEASRFSKTTEKVGQASLTNSEIDKATTTNQHGDYGHTVVELQAIKAVAWEYEIEDWLSYIDPKLTYEENIDIMKSEGDPTNKEINATRKTY